MLFKGVNKVWLITAIIFSLASSGCITPSLKKNLTNEEGRKVYRPQDYGEVQATDLSFNSKTGEIHYTLPQPAKVRIRVGIEHGGAMLTHLLDWEPRSAGSHVEKWNRMDSTGRIDFGARNDYSFVLNARTSPNSSGFPVDPSIQVTFPEVKQTTKDLLPSVDGIVSLRVQLDEKDQQLMTETSFEIALYVDMVFLMEDEVGTNPYNFRLDTKQFSEGEHLLTVNVIGYSGLVGTGTVKFKVNHP